MTERILGSVRANNLQRQVQTSKIAIPESNLPSILIVLADINCRLILETVRDRRTTRMIEKQGLLSRRRITQMEGILLCICDTYSINNLVLKYRFLTSKTHCFQTGCVKEAKTRNLQMINWA